MNAILLRAAALAVRIWTALYTWRLPPDLRDARRADIASDVWQGTHDPDAGPASNRALQMFFRLILGIPDDLQWRMEQRTMKTRRLRAILAIGSFCVLALLVVRMWPGMDRPPLPQAPASSWATRHDHPAPPPPPPPPAVDRAGIAEPAWMPVHAQTSYTISTDGAAPGRVKEVKPIYPPIAAAYGLQGTVFVEARITAAGRVADARVVRPSALVLDRSALQAVQEWEFAPADPPSASLGRTLKVKVDFIGPR